MQGVKRVKLPSSQIGHLDGAGLQTDLGRHIIETDHHQPTGSKLCIIVVDAAAQAIDLLGSRVTEVDGDQEDAGRLAPGRVEWDLMGEIADELVKIGLSLHSGGEGETIHILEPATIILTADQLSEALLVGMERGKVQRSIIAESQHPFEIVLASDSTASARWLAEQGADDIDPHIMLLHGEIVLDVRSRDQSVTEKDGLTSGDLHQVHQEVADVPCQKHRLLLLGGSLQLMQPLRK